MKTQKRVKLEKGMWTSDGWVYRKPTFKEWLKMRNEPICLGRVDGGAKLVRAGKLIPCGTFQSNDLYSNIPPDQSTSSPPAEQG